MFDGADTAGDQAVVRFAGDFAGWQRAARRHLAAAVPPEAIWWQPAPVSFEAESDAAAARASERPGTIRVPKRFVELARAAACHSAPDRWALLYRLLWRLTHGERHLLSLAGDSDVATVSGYAKAVRRDVHKMKAFVRFRAVDEAGYETPRYVAWFEPSHDIVAYAAGFFVRRFANMRWSILTPERSVHWEGEGTPWFSPGADRAQAPGEDPLEMAWQTYYESIFNPARVKWSAMRSEMPVKYWKNMPEAQLIPKLVAGADRRVATMEAARRDTDTLHCGPRPASPAAVTEAAAEAYPAFSLERLAARAALCRNCALCGPATQTVFGEGPVDARLMIVGEQPGDREDLAGRPFVGPAGQLLDRALAEAGIDRQEIYLTNAVKHFKFTPRGKQRLHAKPDYDEVRACRPWLEAELGHVNPATVITLGATAARALLTREIAVTRERGRPIAWHGRTLWPTVHPSHLLRAGETNGPGYARFVADLARAATE
ncbi:DUF4130 domain-containing protein [Salinisphaera sp. Q1T1-3]|nr:DUF4130 domain-containing protein [Salinisphaera sp. Q1T1-3]